jgi:hypothetical protein
VFGGCEPGSSADCGTFTVAVGEDGAAIGAPAALRLRPRDQDVWTTHPVWSPDGRFVTDLAGAMSEPRLQRIPVSPTGVPTGPPLTVSEPISDASGSPATWAPDSRGLVYATQRDPLTGLAGHHVVVVRSLDEAGEPTGPLRELQPFGWGGVDPRAGWARLPDETPPATTAEVTPDANAAGWHRGDVTVRLTAEDPGLGSVDRIDYTVGPARARVAVDGDEATITITGEGTRMLRYRAYDTRGNAEPERTLMLRIDRTKPTIAIQSPTGAYRQGAVVSARYSCADAGSGVASCAGDRSVGAGLDTTTLGARAFGVSATDRAGNAATASSAWSVVAATAPPPAIATPPTAQPPASDEAATLPSAKRCVSRRRFRIRLRAPAGDALRSARVMVNGRRVKVLRDKRLTAPVDLRGLPKGRFRIQVVATTRSGRTLTSTRRYRTCAKKQRSRRR